VSCLHVKPRAEFIGIDWAEYDSEYELAMQERFAEIGKTLGKAGIRPDLIVRHGDVTRELSQFADFSKAELVVVGILRRRGKERAVSGRLAGRMMRHLDTSVLIVPGMEDSAIASITLKGGVTEVLQNAGEWSGAMKAFTARNAGRVCTLEIDDPEIGALVEARSYPLRGVDYDHRDGRLTITVGDSTGTERHLTRSVPAPDSISILSVGGKDTAMSVAHGAGQTLLTF
ncbi:MAG: universal stress protein, partial [Gemmatimonadaceae bacterium]